MTTIEIKVHDDHRDIQPDKPWTAFLTVGDAVVPEQVVSGQTPFDAVNRLVYLTKDILGEEPVECPSCGHVIYSTLWSEYHDEHGNCHAHRAPR